MPNFIISGIPGVDGTYPIDFSDGFTYRESRIIKQVSGVRSLEIGDALGAGDTDVILALALIALRRAGRDDVTEDRLLDADGGAIQLAQTDAEKQAEKEAEDVPPPSALESENAPSSSAPSSESTTKTGSEGSPVIPLKDSGNRGSGLSSVSGHAI